MWMIFNSMLPRMPGTEVTMIATRLHGTGKLFGGLEICVTALIACMMQFMATGMPIMGTWSQP